MFFCNVKYVVFWGIVFSQKRGSQSTSLPLDVQLNVHLSFNCATVYMNIGA